MKVLYITDHIQIARASGGYISDYLNDLTFYGLYELYKEGIITELVDSTPILPLYKQYESGIDKRRLWGGFSSFWLIDDLQFKPDRNNIKEKIEAKYFDLIIYGSVWRCLDYYSIAISHYPSNRIIMIDGHDITDLHESHHKHPYFKRELITTGPNLLPISFALPESKFSEPNKNKTQEYGTVIPGKSSTYIFVNEGDYYRDYNKSFYGVTMKKAGWDTMRHYEIIGSYCMPYFTDLEDCPSTTLTTLPKELLLSAKVLANNFNEGDYYNLMDELYLYAKENLTTKALAQYILNTI